MIIYLQMIESDEDKSKFEQLYIMYKGLMFHVAMKILKNEFDAEDAVHQAFLSLIENLKKISDVKCPKTRAYIVIITERKAIDIIRSRSKLVDMEFWESTYGIEIPLPGDHGLADAMARLPAAYRDILLLRYYNGYSAREISSMLHEAPLQQAILAALNTAMADKNSLIRQITDAMETEIIPFPGGTMSLGDIERRLRELEQQFQTLLEKATDDPAAYGGQFKEILDEQTLLKERRSGILADNNEQAKDNQRILDAAQTLENASPHITEWDESAVRQLVETVKVLSKDEVAVTLKGGIEICQKIMY